MRPLREYSVSFTRRAKKELKKIPAGFQTRIMKSVSLLSLNPYMGKKLEGELANRYSIRVWPYRVIYRINNKALIVEVISIGHRKEVYKR